MSRRYLSSTALAVTLAVNPAAPVTLGVDTSALTAVPPRQLRAMAREAEAIWRANGVTLEWTPAEAGRTPSLSGPTDTVRVVADGHVAQRRDQAPAARRLGAVLFLQSSDLPDNTLSLSVNAIRALVYDAKWAGHRVSAWPPSVRDDLLGRALGRVLAHEIGHYLLIWRSHTPDGLMQPAFKAEALVNPDRGPFALSDRLGPRLRARLAQLATPGSTVAGVQ
jgi:hypothetical protein